MAKNNFSWPSPQNPKFKVGDYVIIKLLHLESEEDVWIGVVDSIGISNYVVKDLSAEVERLVRIPFLFEPLISKINKQKLENSIKNIKLLYKKS